MVNRLGLGYLCIHVIYESLLYDVFRVYTTREPRPEEVCDAYAPRLQLGAYAPQTSDGRVWRVTYTRDTPSNHDSYKINATHVGHVQVVCLGADLRFSQIPLHIRGNTCDARGVRMI